MFLINRLKQFFSSFKIRCSWCIWRIAIVPNGCLNAGAVSFQDQNSASYLDPLGGRGIRISSYAGCANPGSLSDLEIFTPIFILSRCRSYFSDYADFVLVAADLDFTCK